MASGRRAHALVLEPQAYDVREHMPSSHRRYADWTPERISGTGASPHASALWSSPPLS